jgi:NAD(P)H dehydrogenase (quinone)
MHAHFVLAHPEPQSFNANLVREGASCLQEEGWSVTISDLYAMGFDPCERPQHYRRRLDLARFDAQAEQRHASETRGLPKVVTDELALMDRADLLVLQYPMWWHLPPAMMKGWFDRVLAYGDAYTSRRRFELGRFVGKRAMLSITVGTSRATYEYDGRSGDIDLMVWPVNFSLAYVGYEVLDPFIAYGVEAGLRYSDAAAVETRLRGIVSDFRAELQRIAERPTIPFNRMAEWGADGRIRPEAPVHSAFIRRKKRLELE